MPKITINANSERIITTAKKWLELLSLSDEIYLDIPQDGMVLGRVNTAYDVTEFQELRLVNDNDFPVSVRYENRKTQAVGTGNPSVKIAESVTIQDIENLVNVTGNIKQQPVTSTSTRTYNDLTLNAGETLQLLAHNASRKEAFIQILSTNETVLRVGNADIGPNRGLLLSGSIDNPNQVIFDHQSEIWVHNTSASAAKLAVMEVLQ